MTHSKIKSVLIYWLSLNLVCFCISYSTILFSIKSRIYLQVNIYCITIFVSFVLLFSEKLFLNWFILYAYLSFSQILMSLGASQDIYFRGMSLFYYSLSLILFFFSICIFDTPINVWIIFQQQQKTKLMKVGHKVLVLTFS